MGLDLKGVPVAPRRTKERSRKALELLEDIQQRVTAMGLAPYPRPTNAPEALGDLDIESLSNRELEKQFAHYVAYGAYVATKLAEAEIALKIAAKHIEALTASLKVTLFKDEVAKSEIMARVKDSPEYEEADLEHLKCFAIKEILESHHRAYRTQAQALSRVIELRKLEFEQELRGQSIAGFKAPRPNPRPRQP